MYILYVTLASLLAQDIELEKGGFQTIEACWMVADQVARSPEVFSVRCVLATK
jgi:hypothetical protein